MKSLLLYLLSVMEGERKGRGIKPLLFLFSLIFRGVVFLRLRLYRLGLFSVTKAPLPVISVGNLVAGGTGKTPFIEFLANALLKKKIAILSRGYRSVIEKKNWHVALGNEHPEFLTPCVCGDEPYLLFKHLPEKIICIGKKREILAQIAFEKGAELCLLDDGFQYLALYRQREIVIVSAHDLFGKNRFLPFGFLRDHPNRLKEADLIVINGVKKEENYEKLLKEVRTYSQSPCIGTHLIVKDRQDFNGVKAGMFSGIGHPKRFKETLEELNVHLVGELYTLDHETFNAEELQIFALDCQKKGASLLLCTEKDFIKLKSLTTVLPIRPVEIALTVAYGKETWYTFLNSINNLDCYG